MTSPAGAPAERTDRQLVRAVLGGERSAYRVLVERHEDALFRRARAILGDTDLAADAVQDAFIRAYERLADCADPDRFGGWVYRTLRNRCYDELRAARHRGQPLTELTELSGDEDPRHDLERLELRAAIDGALEVLSPLLREAFVLKHVDGLSYDEMQEVTGVARSALKMRVKRAREELEVLLRPRFPASPDVTPEGAGPSGQWKDARPAERGQR